MTTASAPARDDADATGAGTTAIAGRVPTRARRVGGAGGRFRLMLALSAIALVAVVARSAQLGQMVGAVGDDALLRPLLATQGAFWLGWSLWAGALVPLVRRLVERPPSRVAGAGALAGLAIAPVVIVPLVAGPVHWLMFERMRTLESAYAHVAAHNFLTSILLGATLVGVAYGYLTLERARRLEVTAAQLGERLTRAQLDALRAQLNPHFLFNALNSVAVLARRGKVREVEDMVTRLADLLRHSLESSRAQLVSLRVELDALRQYLDIEQVRYGNRLAVSIDVPDALLDRVVPSFLLQPLVENGIRHGFVDARSPLHVEVRARPDGDRVVLSVIDDGAGIAERDDTRDGLGIGNTRARLEGLYGGAASLVLAPGRGGRGTIVTVIVPADTRRGEALAPA